MRVVGGLVSNDHALLTLFGKELSLLISQCKQNWKLGYSKSKHLRMANFNTSWNKTEIRQGAFVVFPVIFAGLKKIQPAKHSFN